MERVSPIGAHGRVALLGSAFLLAITSLVLFVFEDRLQVAWAGYYGNYRDEYLLRRIEGAPWFLAILALILLGTELALRANARRPFHWSPRAGLALLAATLGGGTLLSILEWWRWGFPCWDGYCRRALLWSELFTNPGEETLATLADATFSSHVGTSVVPPFLIGALTAAGPHVALAFMFLNALSWLGVGLMLVRIGRRHFDWKSSEMQIGLILFFGHFAVMRSLLFLQTDPLALLLLVAALSLNLELVEHFTLRRGLALVAVQTIGFFTKLSFAPAFAIPLLAPLCRDGSAVTRWREARRRGLTLILPSLALCVALLAFSGLWRALAREFSFIGTSNSADSDFYADNNALRFVIALGEMLQLLPLAWLARYRGRTLSSNDRLLLSLTVLVPISLIALRAAYWNRYFLPIVPCLVLLAVPAFCHTFGRGATSLIAATAYVAANAAFLLCNLYY